MRQFHSIEYTPAPSISRDVDCLQRPPLTLKGWKVTWVGETHGIFAQTTVEGVGNAGTEPVFVLTQCFV